jgi:hypothetical protein
MALRTRPSMNGLIHFFQRDCVVVASEEMSTGTSLLFASNTESQKLT